jgi:hypothetical protein
VIGLWTGSIRTPAPHVLVLGTGHPACPTLATPQQELTPPAPRLLTLFHADNRYRRYLLGAPQTLDRPAAVALLANTTAPIVLLLASAPTSVTVVVATVEVP